MAKPSEHLDGLTHARLCEVLDINPILGSATWKIRLSTRTRAGSNAGTLHSFGYQNIRIDGRIYKRHRLIWFFVNKQWPPDQIDHINGDRSDDRIDNLRESNHLYNCWNKSPNSCGKYNRRGITWSKDKKKWRVRISVNNKKIWIGYFQDFDSANEARVAAEVKYHHGLARVS